MTEHVRREGGGVTPEILLVGEVTETQKTVLYRNAICMVYPSLYEGFGFPPLEAMQAGTPVITSNNASLPEVVGDAALMIDPHDIMSLTNALRQFVQDSEMRAWYTEKGRQQIKKYSWENTARKTLECLIQQ
jgi:glycosyltransferase involved in cell wall biosynthesis